MGREKGQNYEFLPKVREIDYFLIYLFFLPIDGFRSRDRAMQGQATIQYEDFIGLAMGVHQ
jgi:hypothetical protein